MKVCHYIGIHVIASNDIDIKILTIVLEKEIKKYFIKPFIILQANEPYWKISGSNSIVYSILNSQSTKIKDIITSFPISWSYSEGYAYNVDIQQRVDSEDAIWSKNCHPEEFFLMPEIRWVNIYTLEKEEKTTIN